MNGVVRAPGRVNLIGDHTDYNGLPVLPMAIQRETTIAFRRRTDGVVRVVPSVVGYGEREFSIADRMEPYESGDWGNYVKAAIGAVVTEYGCDAGFDAAVSSSLPIAAGLSSSSALVVAIALVALRVSGADAEPLALASILSSGERYVGTRGGGMDQAAILLSKPRSATLINFDPLEVHSIALPGGWNFIVASSLVNARKAGPARKAYNARTEQCEEARRKVVSALGNAGGISYRDMLASHSCAELLRIATAVLDPPLLRRFRHVVSEGDRVGGAVEAMRAADLGEFGRLMSESHASLRGDYAVSCAELDELVDVSLDSGACGARLTGAGFGGCIVALASADMAGSVVEGLQSRFFLPRGIDGIGEGYLFVAESSDGASVAEIGDSD